jgi:hypothetical protein
MPVSRPGGRPCPSDRPAAARRIVASAATSFRSCGRLHPSTRFHGRAILNFEVPDARAVARPQDDRSIQRDGEGPPIAWFTDPADNVLTVLQE